MKVEKFNKSTSTASLMLAPSGGAAQKATYDSYLNEVYKNARRIESELATIPVTLPVGINKALSIENLLKTEKYMNALKKGTANTQEIIEFLK